MITTTGLKALTLGTGIFNVTTDAGNINLTANSGGTYKGEPNRQPASGHRHPQ